MLHRLNEHLHRLSNRLHAFFLGTTAALLAAVFSQAGQGCALSGQCATCGACVSQLLPIVALPILLDAALTLTRRLLGTYGRLDSGKSESRARTHLQRPPRPPSE